MYHVSLWKHPTTVLLAATLIALGWSLPSQASLRCGNALITQQDTALDVLKNCGQPAYRSRRYVPGTTIADSEIWYYNPGPSRLIQVVTLRQGRVRYVETAGRGFRNTGGCAPQSIETGWSDFELLSRCGEPDLTAAFWGRPLYYQRSPSITSPGLRQRHFSHSLNETVWVEEWQYNFGTNQLIRLVRIENGKVIDIETGGYGFRR